MRTKTPTQSSRPMDYEDLALSVISASSVGAVLVPAVWNGCKKMGMAPLVPVVGLAIGLLVQALHE